jgi:hypothetical protein
MSDIWNGLTGAIGSERNPLAQLVSKFPVLQDLTTGKVPGVYAPQGFQPPPNMSIHVSCGTPALARALLNE